MFGKRVTEPKKRAGIIVLPGKRPRVSAQQKRPSRLVRRLRMVGNSTQSTRIMESLSMLLDSGMDVVAAFEAIKADVRSQAMRRILDEIIADITAGGALWRSVERAGLVPDHVVSLIRIGEESGKLPDNLAVVVEQQQKEQSFNAKVRAAMFYPVIVLVITTIVALGMAWFVLPRLATVFSSLTIQLPLMTRLLIRLAGFLQHYGSIVIPTIVVAIALIIYILFFFSRTRFIGQSIIFSIPGVRRMIREVQLARMGYILGTLLDAGLPIVSAIDSLVQATSFHVYRKLFSHLRGEIEDGHSWKQAFARYKRAHWIVPASIQQLIIAGDESGRLPQTFLKIGRIFEDKSDTTAKNVTVVLEPILLVLVWLAVAGVALAIIMPIYGLISGFTAQQPGSASRSTPVPTPVASVSPTPTVSPSPSPTAVPLPQVQVLDDVTNLRVRKEPTTDSAVITQIDSGETYVYDDAQETDTGVWYRISIDDKAGWVSAEFVKKVTP